MTEGMTEEMAWEIINAFPRERAAREECTTMTDADHCHDMLHYLKRAWIRGDSRFATFTVLDMGKILSDRWCVLYFGGETVGSETPLADCWEVIELDANDLWSGSTGIGPDGDGSAIVNRLKTDLAGITDFQSDDSVEIICMQF